MHGEGFLLEWVEQGEDRSRRDKADFVPYLKFLKERFSLPFVSLLCDCLKLVHSRRASFSELIGHSFLRLSVPK